MKSLSDEQFRAYFLGKLSEPEAEIFEIECALSPELTEQAELVERELADDYSRGNLSPAETDLFEKHYLITEARAKKLRAAQALWAIASEQKAAKSLAAPVSAKSFWQSIFGKRYAFQLAFTGLFLLLILGAIAFYLLTLTVDKNEISAVKDSTVPKAPKVENPSIKKDETENQSPPGNPANPVVENKEVNKNLNSIQKTPPAAKTSAPPKNIEQPAPALATFALLPGTLRDEGEQFITIAPHIKNIRLNLKLPEEAIKYRKYRVVLKTPNGDEIFTAANLKSLAVTIFAEKLENRTYLLFLEGQNPQKEFESVTEYSFRVRR